MACLIFSAGLFKLSNPDAAFIDPDMVNKVHCTLCFILASN